MTGQPSAKPLQRQIFYRFLWIITALGLMILAASTFWFNRTILGDAQQRVHADLRMVLDQFSAEFASRRSILAMMDQAAERNWPALPEIFRHTAATQHFDLGGYLDFDTGRGLRLLSGLPLTAAASWIPRGTPDGWSGYLLLPLRELAGENPALAGRLRLWQQKYPRTPAFDPEEVLVSITCHWRLHPDGRPARLFYAGTVLNLNQALVDGIRKRLFKQTGPEEKPLGTVTIFQGDIRVATNVVGPAGQLALGTPVSDAVGRRVLGRGQAWIGRAQVMDAWYLAAYEPLVDTGGRIAGMIYLGILESHYTDLRNKIMGSYLIIFGLGMMGAIALSYIISRTMVKPLQRLSWGARRIQDGELNIHLEQSPAASREIASLTAAFNEMARTLHDRDLSLQQANEQLRRINQQLETANLNYSEMLGFITHELSNMLGVLILDVHSLKEAIWSGLGPEDRDTFLSVTGYLDKFREMIRNFLDLSRIEKEKLVARTTSINLFWEVLPVVQKELSGAMERRNMTLEIEPDLADLELEADPALFHVLFYNLAGNAVKYGRAGGKIRIYHELLAGECLLHVWNEGPGIPAVELPKLFDKFHRVAIPGSIQRDGTGLGLFICREIVRLHHGTIQAASEPGCWADFCISLPRTAPTDTSPADGGPGFAANAPGSAGPCPA